MHAKYHIWQDENGWRGYVDGYPAYEVNGVSFEELQVKLWQLTQDLLVDDPELFHSRMEDQLEKGWNVNDTVCYEVDSAPATVHRQMSPAQLMARARVELLLLAMITSLYQA